MVPLLRKIKPPKIIFKRCTSIGSWVESSNFPPKWWISQDNSTKCNVNNPLNNLSLNSTNTPKTNTIYRCKPCDGIKCQTCNIITHSTTFKSTTYNKKNSY